jgi:lysozyme
MMQTSANGRKFIEAFEGLFLHAYDDGTGTWTIGYGHTTAAGLPRVYPGMVITEPEADQILSSDLAAVEADVNHHVKVSMTQPQMDSLVSFDFNTGGLDRSSALMAFNLGHPELVPNDLMKWVYAGGRVLPGLLRRRKGEGAMFQGNVALAFQIAEIATPPLVA